MLSGTTLKNMKSIDQSIIEDFRARLKATIEDKEEIETEFVQLKKNFFKAKQELKLYKDIKINGLPDMRARIIQL
jgi:hypothetical protein